MTRTLILPRYPFLTHHLLSSVVSLILIGRSIFRRQLSFRHRCPFEPPARSERAIRCPPRDPPHSQPCCHLRRDPHHSTCSGRSTERDCHRNLSHVRECPDLPASHVCRYVRKAMAEPILARSVGVNGRTLWTLSTQMRWAREVTLTPLCRVSR